MPRRAAVRAERPCRVRADRRLATGRPTARCPARTDTRRRRRSELRRRPPGTAIRPRADVAEVQARLHGARRLGHGAGDAVASARKRHVHGQEVAAAIGAPEARPEAGTGDRAEPVEARVLAGRVRDLLVALLPAGGVEDVLVPARTRLRGHVVGAGRAGRHRLVPADARRPLVGAAVVSALEGRAVLVTEEPMLDLRAGPPSVGRTTDPRECLDRRSWTRSYM